MLPSGEGWGELRTSSCRGDRYEVLSELLAGNLREVRAYHRGGFRSAVASEPTSFPGGLIFIVLEIPRGFFEGVMPPPRGGNQRLNRPLVTQVQVEEACGARAHTGQGRLGLSLDLSLTRGDQGRLFVPFVASLRTLDRELGRDAVGALTKYLHAHVWHN